MYDDAMASRAWIDEHAMKALGLAKYLRFAAGLCSACKHATEW